uniref:Uncharacterized protein n=1 Tax=Ciona savignyi TaxID=51511 RepID=H2YAJ3_CIOSA
MQDDHEEDEEDMDFEVTQVQEDQAASGDNSGTDDSASDSSSSDSEESEDENLNEARTSSNSLRRKTENGNSTSREQSKSNTDVPTVKTTNEMILSKYYRVPPVIADMLKKAEKQLKTSVSYVKRNIDLSAVRICCVCLKKKE